MTADNLVFATNSMRSSVVSLKKKLSNLKVQIEIFDAEVEKIESKFEKITTQAEIYKSKLEREMGREVRRLERELALLRKNAPADTVSAMPSGIEGKVASTVAILDSLLRHISRDAEDFRMASEAFLFPAVYERVMANTEEAYFLEDVPASMDLLIDRGRAYVQWTREEFYTHLTNPATWEEATPVIAEWWRNDALPLLYGARDEQWDLDVPLSLQEMMVWRDNPAERPMHFSAVFDALELYQKHKDTIFEPCGLKDYEIKRFNLDK
jgi:hypothetical protein